VRVRACACVCVHVCLSIVRDRAPVRLFQVRVR